jgi:two-component system, response regulator PdtaR
LAKEAAPPPRPVILVADDDPRIVTSLGRVLRAAGFDVLEAFDAASALELCSTRAVSVAIVDYAMPGMNGIEFARINASRTAVPVIFLSGYSDDEIVGEAIAAGAMTYLVKPVDTHHLLPAIRAALQRSRELSALRSQAQQLNSALQSSRPVNIATGLLMARFQIGQEEAFERLRRQARSRRTRLEEVAAELLRMNDEIGRLYGPLSQGAPGQRPDTRGGTDPSRTEGATGG